MDKLIHPVPEYPGDTLPDVRTVPASRPFHWLNQAWHDLGQTPITSLVYGGLFALLGWGLYSVGEGAPHFIMTYVAGFFLAGPFLAIGLYAVAHRIEHHKPANLWHALTAWHRSGLQVAIYAALIAFLMIFWIRLSWLVIGLAFVQGEHIGLDTLMQAIGGGAGFNYFVIYLLLGALFAALVFSLSVVALPMMQDRRLDIVTAMLTSLKAVRKNPHAMLVWAALIVGLAAIGFATFLLGLVIIFPVLGFATWHAYRDLVPRRH